MSEAERGKASTSVAVYVALLWAYGMVLQAAALADPAADDEGLRLASRSDRRHARAAGAR